MNGTTLGNLLRDTRGVTSIEYLFFLTSVTLPIAFALWLVGPELVDLYRLRIAWLALPIP